ncbi:tyrosine-type recombinase/integrase [Elusimicrobiota bacterium]
MQFRQSLGYVEHKSDWYVLRDFDYHLTFYDIYQISQIDEALIVQWIHAIRSNAPRTKNSKLAVIRGLFRYLVRIGAAQDNPARNIAYLKEKRRNPHIYTLEELGRILKQARQWQHRPANRFSAVVMETLIYLLYACGLRLGEALRLKIKDIDFNENMLSLWKTKFHKERIVPFSDETRLRLKRYLKLRNQRYSAGPEGHVFRHKRGRYNGKTIDTNFKTLLAACGFPNAKTRNAPRLHDLRHSMATHRLYKWYQEGRNILNKLPLLSRFLGHSKLSIPGSTSQSQERSCGKETNASENTPRRSRRILLS